MHAMQVDATYKTDVLVIGGGAAALRAALAASTHGARTTVVLKGRVGTSGATVSPDSPGLAWQVADDCSGCEDSPGVHCRNIIDAGLGMADPKLAHILAHETVDRTEELERWGLRFVPDPKRPQRHYCGYSCFGDRRRAHGIRNSGHGHGGDLVRVLVGQLKKHEVDVHEDVMISDLVTSEGRCTGAVGVTQDGEILAYRAGAVVIAAGGARQIYPHEPGRTRIDTTGDGYAMSLRAGAELTNMEFTQYMLHPVRPIPLTAPGVFWALCPTLRNRDGEDLLTHTLPHGVDASQVMWKRTLHYPFSSRDESKWLDIAIAREIRAGRATDTGTLYLDFSRVDLAGFRPSRPQHLPDDAGRRIELPDELVPIRPVAHAINGGVLIDERAESTLGGLFAIAEASAGPHGADRLGGCMVAGGQVFGARAGRFAADCALSYGAPVLSLAALARPLAHLQLCGSGERDPENVFADLQQAMGEYMVVTRTADGLERLLDRIQELIRHRRRWSAHSRPKTLWRSLEIHNSLTTAELMVQAALLRRESRGSHYREDYPKRDDSHWRVSIIFRQHGNELRHELRSLEAGSHNSAGIIGV